MLIALALTNLVYEILTRACQGKWVNLITDLNSFWTMKSNNVDYC